jgi:aspartate racemase
MNKNLRMKRMHPTKNRKMKRGLIGIAGGMGPGAGIDLSRKIVEQTLAGRDQEHLPQILWSEPDRIFDRTDFLEGRVKTNPAFRIAQVLLKLEAAGASVAGLACNSAHAPQIFDVILTELSANKSKLTLLHMVREVGLLVGQTYPSRKKVGILGTTGTYVTRQYDMVGDFGLETVNLPEKEQKKLNLAIYHPVYGVKSISKGTSERARSILTGAMSSLVMQGAEVIVLGCTEFPLIFSENNFMDVPVIDSSLVLARALINAHSPEKLRPWGPVAV